MARWILRQIAEGWEDYVEIDQQDYATLLCIDSQLTHVLSVEDKYDVTMQNYLEFETSIAEEAIRKLVGYSRRREGYDELRRLLARRLSNVLSSAHLYLRTLNHHSKRILEEGSSGLAAIEAAPHHQYESSLDYRIAEALRNYAQHSALAVHGLISTKSEDDVSGLIDHVEPYLDSDDLKEDGQFKAKVLAELPKDGDLRRLKPIMRGYMEALGSIQSVFRTQTRQQLLSSLEILNSAQTRFHERFSLESPRLLGAVPIDQNGDWGAVVYVGSALEKTIGYLNLLHPKTEGLRDRRLSY